MDLSGKAPFGPESRRVPRYSMRDLQVAYCEGYLLAVNDALKDLDHVVDIRQCLEQSRKEAEATLKAARALVTEELDL